MEEYIAFAKQLAQEAQVIALTYFNLGFAVEHSWKEDNTPLVKADTEINDLVIKRINETYPDHSIYGEEKSDKKEHSKYIWVCDPIDGTIAFSCGLPMFMFSIALIHQSSGQPIIGLIHDPVMKTTYWAHKGGGAFRNGQRIYVSKDITLENTYVLTGGSGRNFSFTPIPFLQSLIEKRCKQMKFPSFTYGGVQVANGKFVGAILYGKYGHDVAALKILTEEAGGKVTDLNGEERRYDEDGVGCILSNGFVHNEIVESVRAGKNK